MLNVALVKSDLPGPGPLLATKSGHGRATLMGVHFGSPKWTRGPVLAAKSGPGGSLLVAKSGSRGPV